MRATRLVASLLNTAKRATASALGGLAALLALASPAQAGFGMPEALTPRGQTVEDLYTIIAILGVVMFAIVFVWLVVVILRFREGSGHGRATHEKERHNGKAEALWIGIPLLIVMWIGYAAYEGMVDLERGTPASEADLELEIVGSQWNWEARYPQGVSMFANPDSSSGAVSDTNTFVVPADTDILLNITSVDVIHAFNILDENRAWFAMNDANPLGSNKYALQVVNFPAGNYSVQCKEMCLNPGHAYMRARFQAVPATEYQTWHAEKAIAVGADLTSTYDVVAQGGKLSGPTNETVVTGTRAILRVDNREATPLTITAGSQTATIPANTRGLAAFDLATAGAATITASNGGSLHFTAVDAEVIRVDLGNFRLLPESVSLKAGTTYLVQTTNVHTTAHNLYFGQYATDASKRVVAASATINGGDSTSFVVTPTQDIKEMWCDVPGHYGAGMHGPVSVTAA